MSAPAPPSSSWSLPPFRIFGVPVRIHVSFPIAFMLLGVLLVVPGGGPHQAEQLVVWLPLITAAVLVHELGHALTAKAFGVPGFIILYGLGGATTYPAVAFRQLGTLRRILVTVAGPGAGVLAGILALLTVMYGQPEAEGVLSNSLYLFVLFTAGWGILNMLPLLPLDGGHVVSALLEHGWGFQGRIAARVASIAVASALGGLVMMTVGTPRLAIAVLLIVGLLVMRNWRALQIERHWQLPETLSAELDRGFASLEEGRPAEARAVAEALAIFPLGDLAVRHGHLLAWSRLLMAEPQAARSALDALPEGEVPDAFLQGRLELAEGHPARALPLLVESLADRGDPQIEASVVEAARLVEDPEPLLAAVRAGSFDPGLVLRLADRLGRVDRVELAASLRAARPLVQPSSAEPSSAEPSSAQRPASADGTPASEPDPELGESTHSS